MTNQGVVLAQLSFWTVHLHRRGGRVASQLGLTPQDIWFTGDLASSTGARFGRSPSRIVGCALVSCVVGVERGVERRGGRAKRASTTPRMVIPGTPPWGGGKL